MVMIPTNEVWVHDAHNPADYVTSEGFGPGGPETSVRGEIRTGSAGRRRGVVRRGRALVYRRTFPFVSREWLDWMDAHIGHEVMVRDPAGRLFHGLFFAVPVPDRSGGVPPTVTITFESITWSIEAEAA